MAENKISFLLYCDIIHTVKKLPKEKQGELFMTILEYVNDLDPEVADLNVDLVFEPIKRQLKRDLEKYESKKTQWSEAGKRSAEARKVKKNQRPLTTVKSRSTDSTVIDTVIVTDIVNVTVNKKIYKKIDNLILYQFEYEKLNKKYSVKEIADILNVIENRTDNKKRKSLYLTALNWLKNNSKFKQTNYATKKGATYNRENAINKINQFNNSGD